IVRLKRLKYKKLVITHPFVDITLLHLKVPCHDLLDPGEAVIPVIVNFPMMSFPLLAIRNTKEKIGEQKWNEKHLQDQLEVKKYVMPPGERDHNVFCCNRGETI